MIRQSLCLALSLAYTAGNVPARAASILQPPTVRVELVTDSVLSEQRAGFRWEGLDISFGADIRSYLDDQLVMQTTVSFTNGVADAHRSLLTVLTPETSGLILTGILAGGAPSMSTGNDGVFLANQGQTAFIQRTDGTIQNIIINTASNVDLRQQIDAHLDIAHYALFRDDILEARIVMALSDGGALAFVRGVRN